MKIQSVGSQNIVGGVTYIFDIASCKSNKVILGSLDQSKLGQDFGFASHTQFEGKACDLYMLNPAGDYASDVLMQ